MLCENTEAADDESGCCRVERLADVFLSCFCSRTCAQMSVGCVMDMEVAA